MTLRFGPPVSWPTISLINLAMHMWISFSYTSHSLAIFARSAMLLTDNSCLLFLCLRVAYNSLRVCSLLWQKLNLPKICTLFCHVPSKSILLPSYFFLVIHSFDRHVDRHRDKLSAQRQGRRAHIGMFYVLFCFSIGYVLPCYIYNLKRRFWNAEFASTF